MSRSARITLQTRERKNLDASLYSSVDAFLKPLKATTRRLQVASTTLANEEQLLQRIYYKGKNQHRSALFWRRTAEIRRYAERAKDLNLPDLLHRLRCSFFGEEALSNQSLLKGAWIHYPEPSALDAMLLRIANSRALFTKFQERTTDAYSSFTVSMQSGAFIQILLVLAAISARMNAIAQEHVEILDGLTQSVQNLKKGITKRPAATEIHTPQLESAGLFIPIEEPALPEPPRAAVQPPSKTVARASLPLDNVPTRAVAQGRLKSSTPALESISRSKAATPTPRLAPKSKSSTPVAKASQGVSSLPKEAKRTSKDKDKKKRKKDEIDDIFGF